MSHICTLCEHEFVTKAGFDYHMKHNVCEKNKCKSCGRMLATQTLYRSHVSNKVCEKNNNTLMLKPKIKLKSECVQPNINELHNNFENLTFDEYQKLCEENAKFKTQPNHLITNNIDKQQINNTNIDKQQINNTNIDKQINNTNINIINISPFTHIPPAFLSISDFSYLMKNYPTLIPNTIKNDPINCIEGLFNEMEGNPNRPEFNSVFISNKREGSAKISDGEKFNTALFNRVLERIIDNKKELVRKYRDNYSCDKRISSKLDRMSDLSDEDVDYQKELTSHISLRLSDMKKLITTSEWSDKLLQYLNKSKNIHLNITDAE